MLAKEVKCEVIEKTWLTPTVIRVRFQTTKRIRFEAGQFLSVVIPSSEAGGKPLRRAYSFCGSPAADFYEISVKYLPSGAGSEFFARLEVGGSFVVFAPYGDFVFRPSLARAVCFISTGTGLAPFRSMVQSPEFQDHRPARVISIFGARSEEEVLYPGFFESVGVETVVALTHPKEEWKGFRGRVTEYLRSLPSDWGWRTTDFYICGNAAMVDEVRKILVDGHGVSEKSLFQEAYFMPIDRKKAA